jgi:hypothetical protein
MLVSHRKKIVYTKTDITADTPKEMFIELFVYTE